MDRLLVISDIHGCIEKFNKLIDEVNLTKKDKLIILGDNIDRGPNNMQVVLKIIGLKNQGFNIINLKGNHESMFLELLNIYDNFNDVLHGEHYRLITNNGTDKSLMEFWRLNDDTQLQILNEIENYKNFHIENNYLFTHAGVRPGVKPSNQNKNDLIWIREEFLYEKHELPYTVVFGHTPTKYLSGHNEIWYSDDKIGIDCGVAFGGKLACLDLTNKKEYYV